jgi:hypothetical protein
MPGNHEALFTNPELLAAKLIEAVRHRVYTQPKSGKKPQ